jgi:ammonium transporter, Amt family
MAIDSGDVAWVLAATALVMLMTPALGFFYGGLVRRKNVVSTIVQCMVVFALVSLVWAVVGYTLAFGPDAGHGLIGGLQDLALANVGGAVNAVYSSTIPQLLYFAFQLKFAAITPALIIGAFAERIRFKALLVFIAAWTIFIYAPIAHWVWGDGGWLKAVGVLDFAGGLVVHISAGLSAVAAALVIGRRTDADAAKQARPNNIPFVILGSALLWFGWFGFNGGSALAANELATSALVDTNLAAAAAALSWMFVEWALKGKPTAVGIAVGAVAGLVAITPASGFVTPGASIIVGIGGGVVAYFVAHWRARTQLDDALDVFACHGAGAVWGVLATGLFATTAINSSGANGLVYGNPHLFAVEAFAIAVVAAFAFVGSFVLLKVIGWITPLRVTPGEEQEGLDLSQHGESAYGEAAA